MNSLHFHVIGHAHQSRSLCVTKRSLTEHSRGRRTQTNDRPSVGCKVGLGLGKTTPFLCRGGTF